MPNDFYYYLTPVKCFPTWGHGLDGYNSAYMYGSWGGGGGGQCLLKQVSYACMDVFVQHAELFDAPA